MLSKELNTPDFIYNHNIKLLYGLYVCLNFLLYSFGFWNKNDQLKKFLKEIKEDNIEKIDLT